MTLQDLIRQASVELASLSPEDRSLLESHLGTNDPEELARRVARDASELWSPSEESGVRPEDWIREYVLVTVELSFDHKQALVTQMYREAAVALIDAMPAERRALVCCLLGTTQRGRIAAIVAKRAREAVAAGLLAGSDPRAAVQQSLEAQLASYTEHVDAMYFPLPGPPDGATEVEE